jgi:hypothetical protein
MWQIERPINLLGNYTISISISNANIVTQTLPLASLVTRSDRPPIRILGEQDLHSPLIFKCGFTLAKFYRAIMHKSEGGDPLGIKCERIKQSNILKLRQTGR